MNTAISINGEEHVPARTFEQRLKAVEEVVRFLGEQRAASIPITPELGWGEPPPPATGEVTAQELADEMFALWNTRTWPQLAAALLDRFTITRKGVK